MLARLRGRVERWAVRLSRKVHQRRRSEPENGDPHALVPVPVAGGPKLRGGAVALAEPDDPLITDAYARKQTL